MKRCGVSLSVTLLVTLCLWVEVSNASNQKALVLLQDLALKSTHSLYFDSVKEAGFDLTFRRVDDKSLRLREWDDWLYDKLVIFAADVAEWGGAVDTESILEFVDAGHDLVLAVDSKVSDDLRGLAAEFGLDVEPRGSFVVDHQDYVTGVGPVDHGLVCSSDVTPISAVLGGYKSKAAEAPVVFKGIGMTIAPDNLLAWKVIGAAGSSTSSTAAKATSDSPIAAASTLTLVAVMQARNNARVLVSGSIELFSNKWWGTPFKTGSGKSYASSGNADFAVAATKWTFHKSGELRATNLRHSKVGAEEPSPLYRIMDEVEFSLDLHELQDGEWVPYKADDVQVEYVMLDPHVRQTLAHNNLGTFSTMITVPDVYGVFKFVVDYAPMGYSYIHAEEQAPVRPFRHNEFDRFLVAAYPYYASTFSTMAAFFIFGFYFLYSK